MSKLPGPIENWLTTFAQAVRERDFAAGRQLFDADVVSFGTAGYRLNGLDQLVAEQWQVIWPKTSGFSFDLKTAHVVQNETLTLVVVEWSSQGTDGRGRLFPRQGRSTLLLRNGEDGLRAVHTHFSMSPTEFSA